jgi:teichuronic acid biosynthesis glycosyltransferase TuaG
MSQNLPVLTVVIPNHNYARWLPDAIRSVAVDDYPNKQLVVVDDGSTDESWEVIVEQLCLDQSANVPSEDKVYAGRIDDMPTLGYRFKKAGGPSRARNLGIKALWQHTGIYGFLDADDVYLPGKISKSIEIFLHDPERIGAVYTDYETINIDSGTMIREYKEPYSRNRLLQECIIHSACMVSKPALEQCGLYDENLRCAEDYDLWLRIAEKFVFVHIPECLMRVRVGSHNSTSTVSQQTWQECWSIVKQKTMARMRQNE